MLLARNSPASSPSVASERTVDNHFSPASASTSTADLPVRTACNLCRAKKIKCDKAAVEDGGCSRCRREGQTCCYDTREPIGRPKKRKTAEANVTSRRDESKFAPHNFEHGGYKMSGTRNGAGYAPALPLQAMDGGPAWSAPPTRGILSARSTSATSTQSVSSNPSASLGTTPSSMNTSVAYDALRHSQETKAPTLTDLGLAVFLEGLDTLEINPEDGLTPHMLAALTGSAMQTQTTLANTALGASIGQERSGSGLSLANMQGSTSYAVPADLSWADSSWLDRYSSLQPYERTGMMPETSFRTSAPTQTQWPRGEEAGMGQAELRTLDGRLLRPAPSCCSSREAAEEKQIEAQRKEKERAEGVMCPKTGKLGCCCAGGDGGVMAQNGSETSADAEMRVHCVPDPTGRGCTCLCDVSVALINVRATLRRQAQHEEEDCCAAERNAPVSTPHHNAKHAASTLQLTLSASQAVAAQCACSASCPTCQSDPSTSLSASLLVSTALQIYVRAVRTLRQGFGATKEAVTGQAPASTLEADGSFAHSNGSEWDVSIGSYKPKAPNARRIALFAMKLELRDLRDAIAKVSRAANATAAVGEHVISNDITSTPPRSITGLSDDIGINPIDQVVIRKLDQQLGDLLRTVETIEDQQDAERLAQSVGSDRRENFSSL